MKLHKPDIFRLRDVPRRRRSSKPRSFPIPLYVTADQLTTIQARAAAVGMSLTAYIVHTVLGPTVVVQEEPRNDE